MKTAATDGRMFVPRLVAHAVTSDDGVALLAPAVGLWRDAPPSGARIRPDDAIGAIEILGVLHRVVAPADASGIVRADPRPRLARRPVAYGERMLVLDRAVADDASADRADDESHATRSAEGLHFRSPLSGRYYARPSPDAAPFVQVGDEVAHGQTVALLEVMKTFNRVTYGGDGLPDRARIVAIGPADGDDLDEDDVILQLEPV